MALGGRRRRFEDLPAVHQHPGDTRHLVGEGERDKFDWLLLLTQRLRPDVEQALTPRGMAEQGHGAANEEGAQISVAYFGRTPEPHFPAASVLSRDQAKGGSGLDAAPSSKAQLNMRYLIWQLFWHAL